MMEDLEKSTKASGLSFPQKRKHILKDEEPVKKGYSSFSESGFNQERSVKSRGVCLPAAIADGLARHHAYEQLIYKQKLKKLKMIISNLVLENAALCDTVASVQDELALAIEDRQYLLRRVMQIQLSTDQPLHQDLKALPDYEEERERILPKKLSEDKSAAVTPPTRPVAPKRKLPTTSSSSSAGEKGGVGSRPKPRSKKGNKIKRKYPPVPLDSSGRPIFPLHLGRLTIHSLGEVVAEKSGYHCENMIFPVGFCSSRMYASLRDPQQQTLYTCTIKEGEEVPQGECFLHTPVWGFDITCEESNVTFYGRTPTECHAQILQKLNQILGIDLLPTNTDTAEAEERGYRFLGLNHPSVQNMIQACPGARKCPKYKWIQFEVCKSEAEAEGILDPHREASLCHETLLRNIRFASNHM